jgi:hypothetical protein
MPGLFHGAPCRAHKKKRRALRPASYFVFEEIGVGPKAHPVHLELRTPSAHGVSRMV